MSRACLIPVLGNRAQRKPRSRKAAIDLCRFKRKACLASESGFSLTEMLVVVAMMAILIAIASPSLVAWRQSQYSRQTAIGIQAALREGRSAAITNNLQQMVVFYPATNSYQKFAGSQPYNTPAAGWTSSTPSTTITPATVTIKSGSTGASTANVYVKFSPNGTAQLTALDNTTPSDSNISVFDQTIQKYLITVTPTGRISLTRK